MKIFISFLEYLFFPIAKMFDFCLFFSHNWIGGMQNDNLFNFYNVHVFYDDARQGIVSLFKNLTPLLENVKTPRGRTLNRTIGIIP